MLVVDMYGLAPTTIPGPMLICVPAQDTHSQVRALQDTGETAALGPMSCPVLDLLQKSPKLNTNHELVLERKSNHDRAI